MYRHSGRRHNAENRWTSDDAEDSKRCSPYEFDAVLHTVSIAFCAYRVGVCQMLFLSLLAFVLSGCSFIYHHLGGPFRGEPSEAFGVRGWSRDAKSLVNETFSGLEDGVINDYHVHLFGNGKLDNHTYCPELNSLSHSAKPYTNFSKILNHQPWWQRLFFKGVYLASTGVQEEEKFDEQYIKRLVDLVTAFGPPAFSETPALSPYRSRFYILAMDGQYNSAGILDERRSFNYVSNRYVVQAVRCMNAKIRASNGFSKNDLIPVGSINPLRNIDGTDSLAMRDRDELVAEIAYLRENGVRWIKWRPATMNLDPDVVASWFYKLLADSDIGILSHSGDSMGVVVSEEVNRFAAPKRMLKAIQNGVRVVLLHVGRAGSNEEGMAYSEEFFELVSQPAGANVAGEISAVPYEHSAGLLPRLMNSPDSLVNGSDYPAVTPYVFVWGSLRDLDRRMYVAHAQIAVLTEIYRYNPLLFDFVLKRALIVDKNRIPDQVFFGLK